MDLVIAVDSIPECTESLRVEVLCALFQRLPVFNKLEYRKGQQSITLDLFCGLFTGSFILQCRLISVFIKSD